MKNNILILFVLSFCFQAFGAGETKFGNSIFNGSVAIGSTAAANSKALLDLTSTTKVMLTPRMTTTQRDAISSPPTGGLVFDTTLGYLVTYTGAAWVQSGGALSFAAVGSSPSDNGASILGNVLTLQPFDATHPGVMTTGTQTVAGAKTFSSTISGSIDGNSATATALAANGSNCSAGSFPLGVNAAGASESCTALPTTITGTANQITASAATGAITLSIPTSPTLPGTTTGTFSGNLSGNATTATSATSSTTATQPAAGSAHGAVTLDSSANFQSVAPGTSGNALVSNGTDWTSAAVTASVPTRSYEISNLGLATSVSGSALTIALKQADGSTNPAAGAGAVLVGMRSSTLTSGLYNQRSATSATSLVISSGSTMGQTSTKPWTMWIYLIDNAGTLELAACGSLSTETGLVTTVAEGGAGAADSVTAFYSTTQRTNVPFRLIGKLINTQTTAGTWASAGTTLQVGSYGTLAGSGAPTIQTFNAGSGTYYAPSGVKWLKIYAIGGGGGGGASGTGGSGAGTAGNDTTFKVAGGAAFITASGGAAGGNSGASITGGAGGATTVSAGANALLTIAGSIGPGASSYGALITFASGGAGGASGAASGFGGSPVSATTGGNGANYGGGGAGGGCNATGGYLGIGGGGGGYVVATINAPSTSYDYVVGNTAAGGTHGTNFFDGGIGAAGLITIEEHYQ